MKNKSLSIIIVVIAFMGSGRKSFAQDPHFSQYFTSPMTLNPALIGKDIGDMRISANFRSQWWGSSSVEPYNTATVSFEKKLLTERNSANGLAVAASMLSDASNGGLLKNIYFSGGISYNVALDDKGNELLGGGITATYASRLFDASKFEFQSQYGSMGFQRSMPSNDAVSIAAKHYMDVNAGIHYSKTNDHWGYYLGASVFHAGTPNEAELNSETYKLDRRFSIQAGIHFNLKNTDQFHVSTVTEFQGVNRIYTAGGVYKIHVNDETLSFLNIGLWNRFGDAWYPYAAIEGKKWLAGVTYDIVNTKDKTWAQSVQSLELSFVLRFGVAKYAGENNVFY